MSYIPNFNKQTDKLDKMDQEFVKGFDFAVKILSSFFYNMENYDEDLEDKNIQRLSLENLQEKYGEQFEKFFKDYALGERTELLCSMFEEEKYDGVELVDENEKEIK